MDTENKRIKNMQFLPSPAEIKENTQPNEVQKKNILNHRKEISDILKGKDDRLLVIVGPCSIHDTRAGREYAQKLSEISEKLRKQLKIVMRVYFEKPRTQFGWKGLINDPYMDGTCRISEGLWIARKFLHEVACHDNFAIATELLEPATPQYMSDLLAWGAIGARTVESQIHRQMASGMSFPVGFKNSTEGSIQPAIDGIKTARNSHNFFGLSDNGQLVLVNTVGNNDCHLVLRGGRNTTNYGETFIPFAQNILLKAGLSPFVTVDCSHGNSKKNVERQIYVAERVCEQVRYSVTSSDIIGVMLESFLKPGKQDLNNKEFGVSVTDPCMGWTDTTYILNLLAESVDLRRDK